MKVLFMGTPDFAAESLEALLEAGFSVCAAVCQPDKPKGRGHKLQPPEVKALAMEHGIPVYQPETLKNGELKPVLEQYQPDVIAVAAYGKLLPEYVLEYPRYGCVNVHGSLLPKYRGAAPIQWAVINGDKETGVTTMLMNRGLDTGDMLLTEKTPIGSEETSAELFDRLAKIGGGLLVKTLRALESGTVTPVAQDHASHTMAPIIRKEMAQIDWSKPADTILNLIRGMNSWPMAYTLYGEQTVKVISAIPGEGTGSMGEILSVTKDGMTVAAGSGAVCIQEVQFPGAKRMKPADYQRGHQDQLLAGHRLG